MKILFHLPRATLIAASCRTIYHDYSRSTKWSSPLPISDIIATGPRTRMMRLRS